MTPNPSEPLPLPPPLPHIDVCAPERTTGGWVCLDYYLRLVVRIDSGATERPTVRP